AYLAESVTSLSPLALQRETALRQMFESRGLDAATALDAAHRAMGGTLQRQAMALAFNDAYRFILIAVLISLPLVLLMKKGAPGGRPGGGAAGSGRGSRPSRVRPLMLRSPAARCAPPSAAC